MKKVAGGMETKQSARGEAHSPSETLLDAQNISISYPTAGGKNLLALDNVSAHVRRGEFITIIGPSGCGKSTFLHCIGGLLTPTSGTVQMGDRKLTAPDPRLAAFVFQEYSLLPWKSVINNTAIGLQLAKVPKADRLARAAEALEMVGLSEFMDTYPFQLSGGMQQRVAVARALAMDPRILLMDEPFGALDEQTRRDLGVDMARTLTDAETSVVMVTHSLDEAIFWADRILVLSARPGKIIEEFHIETPRPRSLEFMETGEFATLRRELLHLLTTENAAKAAEPRPVA